MITKNHIIFYIVTIALLLAGGYFLIKEKCEDSYKAGYDAGYSAGYSAGYADRNKLAEKQIADAVTANTKTETKIVYQTVPYTGTDVNVTTEKPKVSVTVNGKKQEIEQHSETADLAVKTESYVAIKVPERKWTFGLGTDGHKAVYMLKAPVKNAVGVWVAGNKEKVAGGVSISF